MFDTSGLVKYYHKEVGSEKAQQIVDDSANRIIISNLSIVEFISSMTKKIRLGEITSLSFTKTRRRFFADVAAGKFHIITLTQEHGRGALKLLVRYAAKHRLRTLDALQLAIAVNLKRKENLNYFVCADIILESVAKLERIRSLNPETA